MGPDDRLFVSEELVGRLVGGQFPQWACLAVSAIEPGGWCNRTFRLGPALLARLPSAERYAAQVAKEVRWLPRLAPSLPLPVPEPVALGRPAEGYPWPWSVCRWIEGSPADAAPIADRNAFARSLAGFPRAPRAPPPRRAPAPARTASTAAGS